MVFVDAIAIPLKGVKVVVSVTSSACRVRRLRAALLRLQVTWVASRGRSPHALRIHAGAGKP